MIAETDIKAGIIWWQPTDANTLKLNRGSWKTFVTSEIKRSEKSTKLHKALVSWTYYSAKDDCLHFVLDRTRFIRHSTSPNSKLTAQGRIALVDIKKGDEINENFLEYDKYPWPEDWDGPIEKKATKEERETYALAHEQDPEIKPPGIDLKDYVADAGEKGLGLFVGVPLKKGDVFQKDTPTTLIYIPKDAWLTFVNSKLNDVCQGFYDAVIFYACYTKQFESLVLFLNNRRFTNHNSDPPIETGRVWEVVKDMPVGTAIEIDYRRCDYPCPWQSEFLWIKCSYGE